MRKLLLVCAASVAATAPVAASAAEPAPSDFKNAAKYCKALKAASGSNNFVSMFGTGKNAYGKCVSSTARQRANEDANQETAAEKNAAKACKAERDDPGFAAAHGGQTFAQFYGTGNGKNAYGKCVSRKAKQNKADADEEDEAQEQDRLNAAKTCKAAKKSEPEQFEEDYGSARNAFGKCVSQTAKKLAEQRKAEDAATA